MSRREYDELDEYLEEQLRDPEFEAAYEDASLRSRLLKRLVERRKVRGLSQSQVSSRMETTQSAVSDLENGATDPRMSTLQRYARAIGCRLDVCVKDDGGTWRFEDTYRVATTRQSRATVRGAWAARQDVEASFTEPLEPGASAPVGYRITRGSARPE